LEQALPLPNQAPELAVVRARAASPPTAIAAWTRLLAGGPIRVMLLTWLAFLLVLWLGPLRLVAEVDAQAWWLVIACTVAFCVGSLLASAAPAPAAAPHAVLDNVEPERLQRVVLVFAVLGLAGGLAVLFDKMVLSGIDFSLGFTVTRVLRDSANSGTTTYSSSPLFFLGLLVNSLSIVAAGICILRPERLPLRLLGLSGLSLLGPFLVTLVYGARTGVVLIGGYVLSCVIARNLCVGYRGKYLRVAALVALLAVIGVVAFNNFVLADRRAALGAFDDLADVGYTEAEGRVFEAKPWLADLYADNPDLRQTVLDLATTEAYSFRGMVGLQRMVYGEYGAFGPYYGLYSVGGLGLLLDRVTGGFALYRDMNDELIDAGISALYFTIWGCLHSDFGLVGTLVVAVVWGAGSQLIWRRVMAAGHVRDQLVFAMAFLAVVMTPLAPPVGYLNVNLLLLCLGAAWFALRPRATLPEASAGAAA
jgi:hypothetical protein